MCDTRQLPARRWHTGLVPWQVTFTSGLSFAKHIMADQSTPFFQAEHQEIKGKRALVASATCGLYLLVSCFCM